MSKLLSSTCFDSFLLEEATIRMAVTFHIDGRLNQAFYDSEVWKDPARRPYDLSTWAEVRPYCHDWIRGSRPPAGFLFVLRLKPEFMDRSLSDVPETVRAAVSFLNIIIRMNAPDDPSLPSQSLPVIHLVTGLSYQNFILDKSAEAVWDRTMERFLTAKGIEFERES